MSAIGKEQVFEDTILFKNPVTFAKDVVFLNGAQVYGTVTLYDLKHKYIFRDKVLTTKWQLLKAFFDSLFD